VFWLRGAITVIPHRRTAFILCVLLAIAGSGHAVAAQPNGYPISNVNLRAGPGTDFPVILTVQAQAPISILGCLGDYTWCDVMFGYDRGWMRSIYLSGFYQGYYYPLRDYAPRLGYSVVNFDINQYWDSNYREMPFYQDRSQWVGPRAEGWVDRAVFYDRLQPYGDWVWLQGQYVWVPLNVDQQWRPYTLGHWDYTDRYGWMWTSDEPFGWATYHYGRWGFSNQVGWFWVPGSRWGPAWVSWRASDNYLAWAALPPSYDEDVSINIQVDTVPDYYWQVVPAGAFVSADLARYIVRDESHYEPILQETRPLGNVAINNNVVVNNVVNVTYVEQKTNEKVVVHQVENTPDASKAGKIEGGAIQVFRPAAGQPPKVAAPPQPKKIEDVALQTKTKEQGAGKPSTDELLVPPEIKKPLGQASLPPPPLPPQQAEGEQGGKQKKGGPQPGGPPGMQPGMAPLPPPQQAEGEQGGKQKKGGPQPGGPPGMQPGMAPLPPPHEAAASAGKPEPSEKKGKKGGPPCPAGTVRLENGTCAPAHQ
jgi:uncharacterized protein YraI